MKNFFYEKNPNLVIEIKGAIDINNFNNLQDQKAIILNALNTHKNGLIINMEKVTYIDSSGIGMLLAALNKSYNTKRKFYLYNVPQYIYNIFKITNIHRLFQIL